MFLPHFCRAVIARRSCNGGGALRLASALIVAGCSTAPPTAMVAPVPSAPTVTPTAPITVAAVPSVLPPNRPTVMTATGRPETVPGPIAQMLAFSDRVRSLSGAELNAEIARMGDPGDAAPAQMQLALALSATRVPVDLARALGLLQRVIASPASEASPLQSLARALAARFLEQRRIEDDRDRQVQQLREAQRRIDQLNERLEALRAIERSVTRPSNPSAPGLPAPTFNGTRPGT